jgi:hypothetical protein
MLVAAKIFGLVGLVLGLTSYRPLGAVLLALDGVLIAATVFVTVRTMREEVEQEQTQKQVLAQMVREGTLRQYLREVEASMRGEALSPSGAAR